MTEPVVIDIDPAPGVEVYAFGPILHDIINLPPEGPPAVGATKLDELSDVAGTEAGSPGQVLTKGGDGIWVPQVGGGGGGAGQGYFFVQDSPSTVWLIGHGLGFQPAAISVRDTDGNIYFPNVEYVDLFTVRLTFGDSVRGTAYLS